MSGIIRAEVVYFSVRGKIVRRHILHNGLRVATRFVAIFPQNMGDFVFLISPTSFWGTRPSRRDSVGKRFDLHLQFPRF